MAKLTCGAESICLGSLDGKTIEEAMRLYKEALNIPDGAVILLNGEEIDDTSVVLESDDEVEFVKPAGKKGC